MQLAIDLRPFVEQIVVPILVPVLTALAMAALYTAAALFHIKINDSKRAVIETAFANGIGKLAVKVAHDIPKMQAPEGVATVVNYVTATAGDQVKALGISPAALGESAAARIAVAIDPVPNPMPAASLVRAA